MMSINNIINSLIYGSRSSFDTFTIKDMYWSTDIEGRDKLTKTLVYVLKLIDVYRSWRIKAPSFRFERISSKDNNMKYIFSMQDS